MLKRLALIVVILLVGILLLALTKPNQFEVQRSTRIAAAADQIFPLLNDFHRWGSWSPWEKMDPGMTRTYAGPDRGVGAMYGWSGNKEVGTGKMEILRSVPPQTIVIALDFLGPFEAHNTTEFTLTPVGGSTDVIWTMRGPNSFLGKVMSVFVSLDKMVGPDFEQGLANLKAVAEQ